MNFFNLLEATSGTQSGSMASTLILMAVLFGGMYFLMIRPQKKKQAEEQKLRDSIQISDEITTIGGIYGTITAIKDDVVTISVGPDKVRLVFIRGAIASVEDSPVENTIEDQAN